MNDKAPTAGGNPRHPRHLLVTGGSRGIGAAVVRGAVVLGYRVTFTYASREDSARALEQELGGRVQAYKADVAVTAPEEVLAVAKSAFGPIDVLVNNAGVTGRLGPFTDLAEGDLRRVFDVNVLGPLRLTQAVIQDWLASGVPGVVVNVSSIAAATGAPDEYVAYAGAKAAVESITRGLGREFARHGIRVVGVAPGTTATNIHEAAGDPGRLERVAPRVPVGRVADPDEIARAILWVASNDASYITGTTITVAGGL